MNGICNNLVDLDPFLKIAFSTQFCVTLKGKKKFWIKIKNKKSLQLYKQSL
jgi:hypothetical protein